MESSVEYVLQTESCNIMVFYNTFDVRPLCHRHTWKACICFGVCILISILFFFVEQAISSVGSDFKLFM